MYLMLTVPSFIGFLVYSYQNNHAIYTANAEQLLVRHNGEVVEKLSHLLGPISSSAKLLRAQLSENPSLFTDPKYIDTLALHLSNNPNLTSVFTASVEGHFRQVQNLGNSAVAIADRIPPPGSVLAVWKVDRNSAHEKALSEYTLYKTRTPRNPVGSFEVRNNYDPRSRPFFKAMMKSIEAAPDGDFMQINAPYIAASNKLPTLSIATPIVVQKNFLGMTSHSFSLETIAYFLHGMRVSKNSEAFIVDEAGSILVRTNFPEGFSVKDGEFKLRKISDFPDSPLSYAASARATANHDIMRFKHGPGNASYIAKFTPIPNDFNKQWEVLTIAPMSDFLARLDEINRQLVFFACVLILLSMAAYYYLSKIVSRPIERLTGNIKSLLDFNLNNDGPIASSHIDEIDILSDAVTKLRTTLNAFTSYVPRDLVNDLIKSDKQIEIGGESRYLTILFSDLEDFSGLSEVTPTRELLKRVSSYLEMMTFAIKEESGTVDKFIGDAVMAFWGAPLMNQDHGYLACVAAVKSKRRMALLNERFVEEKKRPLKVRIGIHSDAVLVGNIGSQERLSYTVMGDGVNIASRLEGVNKEFSTAICISHAVFKEAGERLCVRPIDQINVKGRKGEILIYELLGILDGSDETRPTSDETELAELTALAFESYRRGEYNEAAIQYNYIHNVFRDHLAEVMATKCAERIRRPASEVVTK
jgi:adenylate cyclase